MQEGLFGYIMKSLVIVLLVVFGMPFTGMAYTQGDINSDNKIDLQESIYSLQVMAGAAVPLSGTTINVPADIPTIQQAIDAASDGDTINIAAGTYAEQLTITGKVINLAGAGSTTTIIDGGGANNGITIEHSPGVSVTNLTVQNGVKGIYASNSSHVEINQVVVKNCTDRGVQLDTNSQGEISGSTIQNNGRDGIGVLRNSNVYISGAVTVKDNSRHGVFLYLGSAALIDGATFASTGNVRRGICLDSNSSLFVNASNLSLLTNQQDSLEAASSSVIGISSGSTTTIETSGRYGVALFDSSYLYSGGAITVRGATSSGMIADGMSSMLLEANVLIENCGGEGFSVSRTSTAMVKAKLDISNCLNTGISVWMGSTFLNNDTANIVVKNITGEGFGVSVYENSVFRASGGTINISNNPGAGMDAGRNSTLSLRDRGVGLNVTITQNNEGIVLNQQGVLRADAAISVIQNTNNGISLYEGSVARIKNMTIQNNGGWGLNVDSGSSIDVSGSTISGNKGGGSSDISLAFGSRSTLNGNTIGSALVCDGDSLSRGDVVCAP